MELAGEGKGVTLLGVGEVADGPFGEVEAEHGADPVEGEGLPSILTSIHIPIRYPI